MEEQFVDRAEKFAKWCDNVGARVEKFGESVGNQLVNGFHMLALFVIGGTIAWSAIYTYVGMVDQGHADIKDILLLFIYLELGAMVGIHFKTHRLPVEFLLTRHQYQGHAGRAHPGYFRLHRHYHHRGVHPACGKGEVPLR